VALSGATSSSAAVDIQEPTHVAEARRLGREFARQVGLGEALEGHLALVVTEMASNVKKHAGSGQILFRALAGGVERGVEVLAIDKGPGIPRLDGGMPDGFSTAGTPGTGLGAIRRQSTVFDLYAPAGAGTVVLAQVWTRRPDPGFDLGAVCLAKAGEERCGEAWGWQRSGSCVRMTIADGSGHGPAAADAAEEALRVFDRGGDADMASLLASMHEALRPTRGAAVAALELDGRRAVAHFCGVGNVGGRLHDGNGAHHLVSLDGIVGLGARAIRAYSYAYAPGMVAVMYSDGLASRWSLDDHPRLVGHHPAVIAAVLFRDHNRGRDDTTVLVAREAAA